MSIQRMIIGSLSIAVVALSCPAREPAPEPTPESGPSMAAVVKIKPPVDGDECATVEPYTVEIYTEGSGKQPKRVVWVREQAGRDRMLRIVHKGQGNGLIGPVPPIPANAAATVSGTSSDAGVWSYSIEVVGDCTVDPDVIVHE